MSRSELRKLRAYRNYLLGLWGKDPSRDKFLLYCQQAEQWLKNDYERQVAQRRASWKECMEHWAIVLIGGLILLAIPYFWAPYLNKYVALSVIYSILLFVGVVILVVISPGLIPRHLFRKQ